MFSRLMNYLYPRSLWLCFTMAVFSIGALFGGLAGAMVALLVTVAVACFTLFCVVYPYFFKIDLDVDD